ncbi:MAG: undecaprenyl-diphosphatase UppP [Candidatus Microgenomates bacterium]
MTALYSVILGIVEGLTEFIPVSSTFHLIATSKILALPQDDFLKLFEVVIQSGAIISIIWLYKDKLFSNRSLQKNLLYSFIPTAIVGVLLYKLIKEYFFENIPLQLSVFAGVGLLFIILEWLVSNKHIILSKKLSDICLQHAVLIGLFQALSIVPGFSRSGSILLGMLALGYTRSSAAEYAFMLSLPTILAATSLDLYQNHSLLASITQSEAFYLFLGTMSAFLSALWVMRWLINYLSDHNLRIFGYYRLIAVVILYFLL